MKSHRMNLQIKTERLTENTVLKPWGLIDTYTCTYNHIYLCEVVELAERAEKISSRTMEE